MKIFVFSDSEYEDLKTILEAMYSCDYEVGRIERLLTKQEAAQHDLSSSPEVRRYIEAFLEKGVLS